MHSETTQVVNNYLGLEGIEFVEFSSHKPSALHSLFLEFGFSRLMQHKDKKVDLYRQGEIVFLLNTEPNSFAESFHKTHGPSISSMGWRVKNGAFALETAVKRGAKAATACDYQKNGKDLPTMLGIGDSSIYLVDGYDSKAFYQDLGFRSLETPDLVAGKGFTRIDHMTNNVAKGTMKQWSDFYKNVFGFYEVRYFDIDGAKTGLTSYAMRSPCGTFCIPINEGKDSKSQIDEYLREYKGAGIQHIAFATENILDSVAKLKSTSIKTLSIDDEYYDEVFSRVPNVTEDHHKLKDLQILIDGDEEGYLLQIFTKNIVGPIFIEIIQRKNHLSFGEGNFGALFRSIEKDQEERGVL
jgi:4-hydroxyphenylpyruvate dioxygenase